MKTQEALEESLGFAHMYGTGLEIVQGRPVESGEIVQQLPGFGGEVAFNKLRRLSKLREQSHLEGKHGTRAWRAKWKISEERIVQLEQLRKRRFTLGGRFHEFRSVGGLVHPAGFASERCFTERMQVRTSASCKGEFATVEEIEFASKR